MRSLFIALLLGTLALATTDVAWSITKGKDGEGMTSTQLNTHFGFSAAKWVNPANYPLSCVDGRNEAPSFGTTGGDFGEYLLAVETYAKYGGDTCQIALDALFNQFVESIQPRKFYWHTDEHVVHSIIHTMNLSDIDLIHPASDVDMEVLSSLLIQPEFVGCGHVANILRNPQLYTIAKVDVVQRVILSFFHHAWSSAEHRKMITLDILKGDHNETAACTVTVRANGEAEESSTGEYEYEAEVGKYPLLAPRNHNTLVASFIMHPQVIDQFRALLGPFFVAALAHETDTHVAVVPTLSQFRAQMDALGGIHTSRTLYTLARALPWYSAEVTLNGSLHLGAGVYVGIVILVLLFAWAAGYALWITYRYYMQRKAAMAGGAAPVPIETQALKGDFKQLP
eukprot:GAFH01001677.1.p2 GENE.GAFH01001677.1~~GAFH01001677.1.p2  ORF type:complete len:404 (-),score=145.64 GAFH01001677.1:281-1471(-)